MKKEYFVVLYNLLTLLVWVFFPFKMLCSGHLAASHFLWLCYWRKQDSCWKDQYYLARYWISKTFILKFLTLLISFVGKRRGWRLLHVNLSVFIYYEWNFQNFTMTAWVSFQKNDLTLRPDCQSYAYPRLKTIFKLLMPL